MTDASDFLMGGGSASAFQKDDPIGTSITGQIVTTEVRQQTDIQSGQPLTWDNGDPKMQLVVTINTDQRIDDEDDGNRALYVKGSKSIGSKSLHDAVRAAVQNANAKGLEPGGTLTVTFIGTEPSKTRGFNDRKLWEATYKAPDRAAETGGFLGTTEQTAPATTATPAPATTTPAPAPVAEATPAAASQETPAVKAKQLKALGITDDVIAAQLGVDASIVPALLA
ncbi:hypothetical protein [Demequina flava]|uniref:hypothetical protein n=1 Tax=Demequina flava TaxID=1095025 RepID=UPI0007806C60|nr:hypothetical protein [Demequina flava]